MIIRLAYLANYFLERDIAGRALFKHADDRFLVAYPGSGGQWLRRLVAKLVDPSNPVSSATIMSRLPDLYHLSRVAFAKIPRPRLIFSHECFDAEYARVVYLVRDPRDVAVSIYEQRRQGGSIAKSVSLEQFVSNVFTNNDESQGGWAEEHSGSIPAGQGFSYRGRLKDDFLGTPASWGENVMSWIGARGRDPNSMLLLRYEDLLSDPGQELRRIADFLSLDVSPDSFAMALQSARAATTPDAPGKWKTVLPEPSIQAIESVWGSVMTALGYTLKSRETAPDMERTLRAR